MFTVFSSLRHLIKPKEIVIDGVIFRLHCRWTVLFLLCASILLTCRQYFGEPISCIQSDVGRIRALETFCWVHTTFILPKAWNRTIGDQVPHPGIDTHVAGENRVYQAYYQWVAFILFFQAILFYTPKYFWRCWERGTMKAFSLNLQNPLLQEKEAKKSITLLVYALKVHWGHFDSYARRYMFCEFLNLLNIGCQMLLMDAFLGGSFTMYGVKVLQWSEWDQDYRTDPLVETFPRMTKCEFFEFGSSGSVQRRDALCILPLNILNEKIYIFLWFWFIFLIFVSLLMMLFHVVLFCIPLLRYYVLLSHVSKANKSALDHVYMNSSMGDWFILHMLAKNIDAGHFKTVVENLATSMMQNGRHISVSISSLEDTSKRNFV